MPAPIPPKPTAADFAEADAIMTEYGADKSERWHADHAANARRQFAVLAMAKRIDAEHRARFDVVKAGKDRRAA